MKTETEPTPETASAIDSTDLVATKPRKSEMTMSMWMATEGGRKCPMCGRYSKASELGYIGGWYDDGHVRVRITAHGHLKGYGCNRLTTVEVSEPAKDKTT